MKKVKKFLIINDVQSKIKHFENINNILNNDFISIMI